MNRSHLIRLNTTPEQEVYFRKACGVKRHAFNWTLARWKEVRAKSERVKMKDLKAEYNQIKGEQLRLGGKIMSATISYRAGWWFVFIAVEVEHETPRHSGGTVGIDLGINTLGTLSCGEKFENQGPLSHCLPTAGCLAQDVHEGGPNLSVQLVDRWFASSKTRHACGRVKEDLTLADRVWVCEQCGAVHDRDVNAAIMVEKVL